jgi:hypothetical protein
MEWALMPRAAHRIVAPPSEPRFRGNPVETRVTRVVTRFVETVRSCADQALSCPAGQVG